MAPHFKFILEYYIVHFNKKCGTFIFKRRKNFVTNLFLMYPCQNVCTHSCSAVKRFGTKLMHSKRWPSSLDQHSVSSALMMLQFNMFGFIPMSLYCLNYIVISNIKYNNTCIYHNVITCTLNDGFCYKYIV